VEHLLQMFLFIVAIAVAYALGSIVESEHYVSIEKREKDCLSLPVVTSYKIEEKDNILEARLVYGSVVISVDYFKRFLAVLRNFTGGRLNSYESLLDRGRREAILRMKKKAQGLKADIVLNMRFETFPIGGLSSAQPGASNCFEILAYGTAVKLKSR